MPSSLTEVLSSTLVCSTSPPVSVCGTGAGVPGLRLFLAVRAQSVRLGANSAPSHHLSVIARTDLPIRAPYRFGGLAPPDLPPCVPPSLITVRQRDRNTNRLSITYAFRPRLRPASPAVDQHGCGTLGHSVRKIRTSFALLVPTFALLAPPGRVPPSLRR